MPQQWHTTDTWAIWLPQQTIPFVKWNGLGKFVFHFYWKIYYYSKLNFNPLVPNNKKISRTTQPTSRCCILNIYSTNILTEYFKHAAHSPFFFSSRCCLFHNTIFFGSCNVHILHTGVLKFKTKFLRQRVNLWSAPWVFMKQWNFMVRVKFHNPNSDNVMVHCTKLYFNE